MSGSGAFTFTWTSKAQDNADGKEGVYLQRYARNNAITYSTGDGVADPLIVLTGSGGRRQRGA